MRTKTFSPQCIASVSVMVVPLLSSGCHLYAMQVMFWSGLIGAVIFRRNLIVMLLTAEIVMLACNLNFLFAAAYLNDMMVSVKYVCEALWVVF